MYLCVLCGEALFIPISKASAEAILFPYSPSPDAASNASNGSRDRESRLEELVGLLEATMQGATAWIWLWASDTPS